MTTEPISIPIQHLTQRTVRAWWTDGLWDFAVAGFSLLLAGWFFVFIRVIAFPTWSWPWPFITEENTNPMQMQLMLWVIGLIPITAAYMYVAYKIVTLLKSRWLASRQGDVRHPFWLKVEPKLWIIYLLVYLGMFVVITWLVLAVTGDPHFLSTVIISAFSAILIGLGSTYSLARYVFSGILGFVLTTTVELFATTPADYMAGPKNFLDVSPMYGNPAVPLLIFAAIFVLTGLFGLAQVLRRELEGAAQ